jgi:hypothetical protein
MTILCTVRIAETNELQVRLAELVGIYRFVYLEDRLTPLSGHTPPICVVIFIPALQLLEVKRQRSYSG